MKGFVYCCKIFSTHLSNEMTDFNTIYISFEKLDLALSCLVFIRVLTVSACTSKFGFPAYMIMNGVMLQS